MDIEAYQQHLRTIDIEAWENGRGDWFTIHLFNLMSKADGSNFAKLSSVYPEEAAAFTWWRDGKPGQDAS